MNKIFDATTAGVGPCGGSCRRKILPMLEQYLKTGSFPEKILEDTTGKIAVKPASAAVPAADTANVTEKWNEKTPVGSAGDVVPDGTKKPNSSDENR